MLERRRKPAIDKTLLAGPGSLSKALGITVADTSLPLDGERIWIEDQGFTVDDSTLVAGPRIGVDYAGDDAARPYRFRAGVNYPDAIRSKEA